jgi:chemotaxis protein methyltransferase CheR
LFTHFEFSEQDNNLAIDISGSRLAGVTPITQYEFLLFKELLYNEIGIHITPEKKSRIESRLVNRLLYHGFSTYFEYYQFVRNDAGGEEMQMMIDLLTTNETFFFRESAHFDFLCETIIPLYRNQPLRVWSAACSTGEEAYSLGMVLDDRHEGANWELMGSDISERVLKKASKGHYQMLRYEGIPESYLKKYCLRGTGQQDGTLLVNKTLRDKIQFCQVNLNAQLMTLGIFDVIFLRNVLIYFSYEKKAEIVKRVVSQLSPGGYLIISHTETLQGIDAGLRMVRPSIYRKQG